MTVEIYGPNHISQYEPEQLAHILEEPKGPPATDAEMRDYVVEYFKSFRETIEEFFPQIGPVIAFYASAPYHTIIVRMGHNAVLLAHRRSDQALVEVKQLGDFDPPFEAPLNIFDMTKRLQCDYCYFKAATWEVSTNAAHLAAVRDVLGSVLEFFWSSVPSNEVFERIVVELIRAEGIALKTECRTEPLFTADACSRIKLLEPAGYRRFEEWLFTFKHRRASSDEIRQVESWLNTNSQVDYVCIVTSDDLTSIGRHVASTNPRIRVWDRSTLNRLMHQHLRVMQHYFREFPTAVEVLAERIEARARSGSVPASQAFAARLKQCPTGKDHFKQYEDIGIEIISHLFQTQLGPAKPQDRTLDGKQRRDVLFRNNRTSPFFERCFHKFGSDHVIIDFKNYSGVIESSDVTDVSKYANKALGRLVIIVSRNGASESTAASQIREFRDHDVVVLVISDVDLIEMLLRKERDHSPEDVIEDRLDELLRKY